jgi:hypothetical protein
MNENEIMGLRKEISELRAQIDDLIKAQNNDREEAIKAIKDVYTTSYQSIAKIHDFLWPVVNKVFPKWAASERQIAEFMKGRIPIDGEEKRP